MQVGGGAAGVQLGPSAAGGAFLSGGYDEGGVDSTLRRKLAACSSTPQTLVPGRTVNLLAEDVGVAAVSCQFPDHVHVDVAQ